MTDSTIVVAGATGNLGGRMVKSLLERGAGVKALVRPGTAPDRLERLRAPGVEIAEVDLDDAPAVASACAGAACVVSALAGLRNVIVDTQSSLLDAAVQAGVPRFIPSDYSLDFCKLPAGTNRNLDLRREFHKRLDKAPISATTVFNGAFADMLTGQMPLILFGRKRIFCWGDRDQKMAFTTMDNTAAYTAAAALDPETPRFLRIAGDQLSANDLAALMTDLTGEQYRILRPGGLWLLGIMIKLARTFSPKKGQLYPAWQGMQYMHNMLDGRAKLDPIDNARYPGINWTTARDLLTAHLRSQ
jgi:uncharacterized protein YbjT (DUF2867 family)